MSAAALLVGRRRLLVLVGTAATIPACSDRGSPPGGPYPEEGGVAPQPDGSVTGCSDSGGSIGGHGDTSNDGGFSGDGGSNSADSSSDGGMGSCSIIGNVLLLPFSQYPQLKQIGGSAQVTGNYQDPFCFQDDIIVICIAAGQYSALSSACTHACCPVNVQGSTLYCPCHGSVFDFTGKVVCGPAARPLPSLKACADANGVYVTLP